MTEIKAINCPECGNPAFLDVIDLYHCREGHYWDLESGEPVRVYPE